MDQGGEGTELIWEVESQNGGVQLTAAAQQLVSVTPSGQTVWTLDLPAPTAAQQEPHYVGVGDATVGNRCPAIGADGKVYVGNFDGLHAVDGTTGLEKTGFPFLTTSPVLTAAALSADGIVFFGTADGTFYAIHSNGTQRFQLSAGGRVAGGRVAGSPAIGPSYFTADDGNLYAVN